MTINQVNDRVRQYLRLSQLVNQLAALAGVTNLEAYFNPPRRKKIIDTGKEENWHQASTEMMEQFAVSLQNSGQMHNIVGLSNSSEGKVRWEIIRETTYKYCPQRIVEGGEPYLLYQRLFERYCSNVWDEKQKRRNEARKESQSDIKKRPRTSLGRYARGLYDASVYLLGQKGNEWAGAKTIFNAVNEKADSEWGDINKTSRELADKIAAIIYGLGPALSRDFLKECGCLWLAKPDTHILKVLKDMGEDGKTPTPDAAAEMMFDFAKEVRSGLDDKDEAKKITAYRLDKMIWLLCTGNFYIDNRTSGFRDILIRYLSADIVSGGEE